MESRANYALVGLFTLAVIAAAFGFVYWFRAAANSGERAQYEIVFPGSVSGLSKGAAVRFNGIRVGEVLSVDMMLINPLKPREKDNIDPARTAVMIAIDPTTPIRTDTRAKLDFQGLTGVASVQLTGNSTTAQILSNPDGKGAPVITAERSDFQDLLETAQRLAGKIDTVVSRVDKVLADAEGPVSNTLRNIESFSQALNENSPGISSFVLQITATAQRFSALSDRVEKLAETADELLKGVEPGSVGRVISNTETFTKALAENKAQIDTLLADAASLAKRLNDSAPKLDTALVDVSRTFKAIDADRLNRVISETEKFTSALGNHAGDVDKTLQNAAELTAKLNKAADSIQSVMKAAEAFLTDGQGKSVMVEIGETAKSIRILAGNLDRRTAEITAGVNRFTGPGLRELEALTSDARKTVNEVGRAVRNLERNPQQFITGGRSNIPEYGGNR
ncbi:MAG: MlaD family protein [Proteobacteria bacterium]|nr:MlaD family protein [Pseudomonadota bacterium]